MDWLDFRERIEISRYFRVFEGESAFTALFNDIFSYISKTTGPILILCCSVYSLSSSEHVFPISRQNRFSSFRDIAKKGFTAFFDRKYLENYCIDFNVISEKHVRKDSGNILSSIKFKSIK